MTSFGRFETVQELHHSGFTVLYSGRTAADPAEKFAIKVFQPSTLLLEAEQVKTESELFLNSAHVQQKTAASGAQYWAPIYECGSIPNGAFYATDKYDHSLQQLIDVRVALTAQALREIVESVAKGLVELKQECGRPHGNLKATNILIVGEGDISQTTIALSDPLPDEHIDKAVHWDSDLRDIAEFIYQLVIHRPTPNVDGWQVPDSKEWAKLGKQSKDWRNLCNRLLNVHIKPGTMTIEMLIEELARLKKIKPVFSARRLLIAAGLIVIAGVAVLYFIPPSKTANIKDWNHLLTEYLDWVGDLRISLTDKEREKRWMDNPDLNIIAENIKGKEKASYLYYMAIDRGELESDLKKIKSEKDLKDNKIYDIKIKKALIAIEIIKYFFDPKADPNSFRFYNDPNSPADRKEYQKWPLLVEIHDAANSFTKHGWQRAATYLQNLIDDIKPDPNIAENVDKILELQPSLDDIKSRWANIENNETTIANSGDLLLSRFRNNINQEPALGLGEPGEADVIDVCKKLHDELGKIEQLSSALAESIEDNWKKLEENRNIIKSTGNPTLAKFPDYIQSKLASADLDILGSELEQISSLADKVAKFVEDNWQKVEENQKTVENTGDPILAKFPGYIQSKLASANMDILDSELEQIRRLVDNIANSIENIWQKADKEAFLNDHGNDSEEILTDKTFTERLDTIKDYFYLVPDPRDELVELVNQTKNHIEEAKGYNPQPADECAKNLEQVQPDIEAIREFRGIKKEEDEINKKINDLQPVIVKINEIAISLIETPEEWVRRISEDSRIASSEVLNEKWIELRDKVFKGLTADELDKNKKLYQVLRKRVKDTKENLVKLDGELLRGLPSQIDAKLEEKGWNRQLKEVYDEERKKTIESILEKVPLHNEVPDISDPLLEEFRQNKFSEFEKRRNDFSGILEAFNKIEDGLDGCYLLSDELPEIDGNIRSLWEKWRNTVTIREAKISEVLAILTERLARLEEIEESNDRQKLAGMALEDESYTEAVYAAWLKLGELAALPWPDTDQEWNREKEIQEVLRAKLQTIKGEDRTVELVSRLDEDSLKREKIFRGANIRRYKTVVKSKSSADPVLTKFETLEPYDADADLSEVVDFENLAKALSEFANGPNWPGNFRTDLLSDESPIYKKSSLTKNDFQSWMEEAKDYRKLDNDPRNNYSWTERISKINELVGKELVRKQDGASLGKFQKLKSDFDNVTSTINNMLSLPAIEKHKVQILKAGDYWVNLLEIEKQLKPEYCKRIELENGRLIFATSSLRSNFEPIDVDNKKPVALTTGWEQIRQAIRGKQKGWVDFFYTIDGNDTQNMGWPQYARSTKDPNLIFRFIPANPNNPEPFYMATHEITNAQYRDFLEKTTAISKANISGWSWFTDQSKKNLILCQNEDPPCAITWDISQKAFAVANANAGIPVIYVTYQGAQSYAESLGAQLPTVSQHKYACKAGTDNLRPWGNNLSEISSYAHVRAGLWQSAANQYNSKVGTLDEIPPPPVGAVSKKDFTPYEAKLDIGPDKVINNDTTYNSAWPITGANKPNIWGLYDMVGNVWEWCKNDNDDTQSVICGGSCLAPPEYLLLETESNYQYGFDGVACDVGFRVIVPAK